ncbi:hypothetical protein [Cellulomonas composti]|uniref:Lipoprotein n=1 Tax=Cellulomonas composti TaxID=266130 RepID=A0A511JC95_9CELL|nr:hypothetical protein [Cellulomonas composti]GEL95323.1 hypothetical protein CCO02nite_19810 [Cellulomonas composti]
MRPAGGRRRGACVARLVVGLVGLVVLVPFVGLLAGCGGHDEPRPVTQEEAELLATVRFRNYDAGAREVSTVVEGETDAEDVQLDGWVDFADHRGYALLTQDTADPSLIAWDGSQAVVGAAPDGATSAPLPAPVDLLTGEPTSIDASASREQALLLVLLDLADDRPENPLLLQQEGATFVRSDEVGGVPVSVLTATADGNARYWVDAEGLLRRFEVLVGGEWSTVDLGDAIDPAKLGLGTGGGS